ncbi:hypothetical protein ACFL5W_00820 [Thermodesulfobacteriota bacterium]
MPKKQPLVDENEYFITLMRVAEEDKDILRQLLAILSQTDFNRTSMLNTLIDEMRLKKAPSEIIAALVCLLDHKVAHRALQMLGDHI